MTAQPQAKFPFPFGFDWDLDLARGWSNTTSTFLHLFCSNTLGFFILLLTSFHFERDLTFVRIEVFFKASLTIV